ncbi:hypothetical protein LZ496_02165 [Sphingomonas sp. NSE70-1]|uniref:Uncharacterized protein n=1 Tax=Sphingomonas caseinilyticus TaxID=2908205 RepID=A0ABT0RRW5_9SPHN|nr:hypothetical protein [Sphingomonas caseinilyticus]MCL6697591.1 hypothetical protein [Sphingomonas caseinilyticus]
MDRIRQIAIRSRTGRSQQGAAVGMISTTFRIDPRELRLGGAHRRPVDCLIDRHSYILLTLDKVLASEP